MGELNSAVFNEREMTNADIHRFTLLRLQYLLIFNQLCSIGYKSFSLVQHFHLKQVLLCHLFVKYCIQEATIHSSEC